MCPHLGNYANENLFNNPLIAEDYHSTWDKLRRYPLIGYLIYDWILKLPELAIGFIIILLLFFYFLFIYFFIYFFESWLIGISGWIDLGLGNQVEFMQMRWGENQYWPGDDNVTNERAVGGAWPDTWSDVSWFQPLTPLPWLPPISLQQCSTFIHSSW